MSLKENFLLASIALSACGNDSKESNKFVPTDSDTDFTQTDTPTEVLTTDTGTPMDTEDTDSLDITDTATEITDTETDTDTGIQLNPTQEEFQALLTDCLGLEEDQGIDSPAVPLVIANGLPDPVGDAFVKNEKAEVIKGVEKIFGVDFEDIQILNGTDVSALYTGTPDGAAKAVYFYKATDFANLKDRDWTYLHPSDSEAPFLQCFWGTGFSTQFGHHVWRDGERIGAGLGMDHSPAFEAYGLPETWSFSNGMNGTGVDYPVELNSPFDFTPTQAEHAELMGNYGRMQARLDLIASDPRGYGVDTGGLNGSNGKWVYFPAQQ